MASAVLIVHHEPECRDQARAALEVAGHSVVEASDLTSAWQETQVVRPDLILLPWLRLRTTREALSRIRQTERTKSARIIVWAERPEILDAVTSLELGADDYLAIPFERVELVARVNACLRRPTTERADEPMTAGPLVLDRISHRVLVQNQPLELAPAMFRLLAFFLENQGRVFSRKELLHHAWSRDAGQRTVDVHVRRLRQLLEPFGCDGLIQTVRGFGYRFAENGINGGRETSVGGL